jgi:hypothetical protein
MYHTKIASNGFCQNLKFGTHIFSSASTQPATNNKSKTPQNTSHIFATAHFHLFIAYECGPPGVSAFKLKAELHLSTHSTNPTKKIKKNAPSATDPTTKATKDTHWYERTRCVLNAPSRLVLVFPCFQYQRGPAHLETTNDKKPTVSPATTQLPTPRWSFNTSSQLGIESQWVRQRQS